MDERGRSRTIPLDIVNSQSLKKIPVTKLDAVRRQLETGVILWFHDGDPVSIHTLIAAAYQILYNLNQKRGGSPMMKNGKNIRPEYLREWHRVLAKWENFFKHADRDPLETLLFPPQVTRTFMLDAIEKYHELAHEQRPLFRLFTSYLAANEPRLFKKESLENFPNDDKLNLAEFSKREFFHYGLLLFRKIE